MSNTVVYSPHPLLPAKDRQVFTNIPLKDQTLKSLLDATIPNLVPEDVFVFVNDKKIHHLDWEQTPLLNGDHVTVRQRVHGGDDSNPLQVILQIVIIAIAIYTGQVWLAESSAWIQAGATAAVMIAGTYLIQALFPPAVPDVADASPTYSIQGQSNRARPYSPLPLVVGKHKIFPDLGAQPYTTQTSEDVFLHQIFNFGFGDLVFTNVRIGETAIGDYQEVEQEWNDANGLIDIFPTNVDTTAGGTLVHEDGWLTRTTPVNTTRIECDIVGTLFATDKEGKFTGNFITLAAEYREVGSGTWLKFLDTSGQPPTVQQRMARVTITVPNEQYALNCINDDPKPYRKTIERVVPKGQYEVRIQRLTPTQTSRRQTSELSWAQMKSYQVDDSNYKYQNRLGVRIRASGQFNGTIAQLSAVASARIPVWNGSGWVTQESSNPAYIYLYLARGDFDDNGRRLFGAGLNDTRIDIEGIKEWGAWCTAHGLECNYVFDTKSSVAEMLQLVARCGRGTPTWQKGVLGVVYDEEDLPITQVFGMANIIADSFTVNYITANLADEIVVKFINEDLDFQTDEVRVLTPGTTTPIKPAEINIPGVTTATQAGKEANLIAARQYYNRRRVSFETDVEGLVCSRGDVITVSHDLTNWAVSGRLVAGTTTQLTLDREVTFTAGPTYYIGVRYPDNTYVIRGVTNPGNVTTNVINLTSALPSAPNLDSTNLPHDYLYFFDPQATPGKKLKIVALEPVQDNRIRLTAIDEVAAYYDSEDGVTGYVPPTPINQTNAAIVDVNITEQYQGATSPLRIIISWGLVQAVGARLRVRRNGLNWNDLGNVNSTSFTIELFEYSTGDQIEVELTAIPSTPQRNDPLAVTYSYFVLGSPDFTGNIVVPSPTGLEIFGQGNGNEFTGKDAKFIWRRVAAETEEIGSETLGAETGTLDDFFQDYEIRIYNVNGTLRRIEWTKNEEYTYTYEKNAEDGAGDAVRSFRIAVYLRTKTNQVSNVPASMLASNPAPETPTGVSVTSILRNLYVKTNRPQDLDLVGMIVCVDTVSGFTPGPLNEVHRGPETSVTIDANLSYGTTYYVRIAWYDGFDDDDLNFTAEYTLIPTELSDTDVQIEINNRVGLINTDAWVQPATDPMGDWDMTNGGVGNTSITTNGLGPFNTPTPTMTIAGSNTAPGWFSQWRVPFDVTATRPYMSLVWVKRRTTDTTAGLYIGWTQAAGYVADLGGAENTNPYSVSNQGSILTADKWYLAVGILHPTDTTAASNLAGLWDPDTGTRVYVGGEFKHLNTGVIEQFFRFGFYSNTTTFAPADGFIFARPDVYIMDGAEPSIPSLLRRVANQGALATLDNITTAEFAAGLTPVEIVGTLPVTGNFEGRMVYLTTDNKMYRYDGSNWITSVATADLSGTINLATQISGTLTEAFAAAGLINSNVTINSDGTLSGAGGGQATLNNLVGTISLNSQVSGTLTTAFADAGLINSNVTVNANGTLTGAGGGQVSLTSLPGTVAAGQIAANAIVAGKIAAGAVTAGTIDADAVTSNTIAANAVIAGKIAANAVTANELAANSVVAGKIAALAITAGNIQAGAVTTDKMTANSINGDRITANTLNADKIVSNSITAGQIQAGAIGADQIAANSIRASKIAVTNAGQALNKDPLIADLSAWYAGIGGVTDIVTAGYTEFSLFTDTTAPIGTSVLRFIGGVRDFSSERIPIDPNKVYRISLWVRQTGTGNHYLTAGFFDNTGTTISGGTTGWSTGTYHYWNYINQPFPASWTKTTVVFGPGQAYTIPAGAKFISIGCLANYAGAGTPTAYFADYRIEEVIPGQLIVDGAITATKITVSSLSSVSASMGSLTSGTITLDSTGHIKSGQTNYNTGSGFWLGKDGATTKFSLGSSSGNRMTWDGSTLNLTGTVQSSNYSAGSAGWQIQSGGNAEFNTVTIRGNYIGTGTTRYEITPSDATYLVWAGPAGAKTDAAAVTYVKQNGEAYFGGDIREEFKTRAWARFYGTTTAYFTRQSNFSAITKIGTGRYQFTFSTPLPNKYYCVIANCSNGNNIDTGLMVSAYDVTTTGFKLAMINGNGTYRDTNLGQLVVYGSSEVVTEPPPGYDYETDPLPPPGGVWP